jgi:cellulose synthase/poly-beta-1,6-N-acetylglucosamine synthase-like glycosyltransferase
MSDIEAAVAFILAQTASSLLQVFWFTLLFDLPHYFFSFLALAVTTNPKMADVPSAGGGRPEKPPIPASWRVSVIVVGHNEADSVERCARSLREQSFNNFEMIIVSDGSSDGMGAIASRLVSEGIVQRALATNLRGGKSAGLNLAISECRGDIIINVDCDCSYDRFAIENILRLFLDPAIGAACGDIVVRNPEASLVAQFQAIEYLLAISLGKRIGYALEQVVCISGAFGAFRREALQAVGEFHVGGGEDLDLTLRLRAAGWRVGFAHDAICYTSVPVRLWNLVRQRLRWERDSVRLRYRKYASLLDPRSFRFHPAEALHQWEFLVFSVLASIVFPIYIVWLYGQYGGFTAVILLSVQIGLLALDAATLALAAIITGRPVFWSNLPYILGFSIFTSYFMRFVRLWAYAEEWFLYGSSRDNFVPEKVRKIRKW